MSGLHRRCLELGVEIIEDAPVDRVERTGMKVSAVHSGTTRFASDAFLLAAGAWSGPVSKRFGFGLPIRPGKGYSVDVAPVSLGGPTYLADARVAVTPLEAKLRLAGTLEFSALEETVDPVRIGAIARAPQAFFRDWEPDAEPKVGAGVRPMTPDGLPVIGRLGNLDNAFVSSGHATLGVTLAPSSAVAISDLILQGQHHPTLDPFAPGRFGRARGAG